MARRRRGYVRLEWVCPNCNTRNPGPRKTCTNCGAPQPDNVQFQRTAGEKLITDPKSIKAAQAGADYVCPYCGTRNSALAETCTQCGGDLVEARRRASGADLAAYSGPREVKCTNCGTANPVGRSDCSKCGSPLPRPRTQAKDTIPTGASPSSRKRKPRWWLWVGIAAAVAACVGAIALFALPSASVAGTVSNVRWETSVPIQEMRSVQYSNESGSPPSDAYDIACHTEDREVCEEHVIDQGSGYGEVVEDCRTESEQYCSYTVDEWTTVETFTLDGTDLQPVYAQPQIQSDQRIGEESGEYTVLFTTDKGEKPYSPSDAAEFSRFRVGSTWTLSLNAVGSVLDVAPQ